MLALVGSRVCYRTIGHGVFHCERCGGDRPYRHRSGRRWAHLLGVPLALLGDTGEHLRCAICLTCYRTELLAVPTVEQMLVALLAGTKAAVLAMLSAGGAASPSARHRAISLIRAAGAPDYHDGHLLAALAGTGPAAVPAGPALLGTELPGAGDDAVPRLRPAVEALAIQLEAQAREWFLATMVEVGLADGALTEGERAVARTIARYLGMSAARGRNIISLTEEAAQAG
jgi:hypothetical protein